MFRGLHDKHWPLFYGFENVSFAPFCVYSMLIWKHSTLPEHYENLPMQYTVIFKVVKNENFQ